MCQLIPKPPKTQNKIIMMHAMKKLTSPLKDADIGKISLGKYTLLIFLGKLTENGYWLKQSNGSTMPILNNALIENTKVILPKNELYLEFENIIKPFYEKIYNIQKENQELTSLRDFLLPLLMNGQVGFKEVALAGE